MDVELVHGSLRSPLLCRMSFPATLLDTAKAICSGSLPWPMNSSTNPQSAKRTDSDREILADIVK